VVEPFEANTDRARSLAESNQTDSFDDAVAGFAHDGEPDDDEWRRFRCLPTRGAISPCRNGPFRDDAIDVFRDPPADLFDRADPGVTPYCGDRS